MKDNGGRSRKKHEDDPEGMYEKLMIMDEVEEYVKFFLTFTQVIQCQVK